MRISCFVIDYSPLEKLCYKPYAFMTEYIDTYEASSHHEDCTDIKFVNSDELVTICVPFAQFNNVIKPDHKFTQKHGIE